jgi:hypothetical protein
MRSSLKSRGGSPTPNRMPSPWTVDRDGDRDSYTGGRVLRDTRHGTVTMQMGTGGGDVDAQLGLEDLSDRNLGCFWESK